MSRWRSVAVSLSGHPQSQQRAMSQNRLVDLKLLRSEWDIAYRIRYNNCCRSVHEKLLFRIDVTLVFDLVSFSSQSVLYDVNIWALRWGLIIIGMVAYSLPNIIFELIFL